MSMIGFSYSTLNNLPFFFKKQVLIGFPYSTLYNQTFPTICHFIVLNFQVTSLTADGWLMEDEEDLEDYDEGYTQFTQYRTQDYHLLDGCATNARKEI